MSTLYNQVKYVHLMVNNKFNKPFVDFLNKNFNSHEHIVLCKRCFDFPFPEGDNVIEVEENFYDYVDFRASHFEKIICHSLFDEELVDYFYENQDVLKEKAYWQIWGGDLYNAKRDEKNDFVRTNFKGYVTAYDEEYAKNKYGMQGKFFRANYFAPINKEMVDEAKKSLIERPNLNIQINNSADYSTFEMLEVLSKYKKENVEICTIVSYGEMQHSKAIYAKGKEIFDNKFYAYVAYLPPELYAKHLANQHILIMNQDRQQGIGNVSLAITFGLKVFIKKDISVSKRLKANNIAIYDTESIVDLSFNQFKENTMAEENIKNRMKMIAKDGTNVELWRAFFEG